MKTIMKNKITKALTLLTGFALTTSVAMANDDYADDYSYQDEINGAYSLDETEVSKAMLRRALRNKTFLASLNKQHAYFEGSQIVRRFFLCIPEASNQKFNMERMAEVNQCFYDITSPDIELDLNGALSYGVESTISIATDGLAQLRQNAIFSPTSFYVSHYEPGNKPGTGRMEFNFNVLVHQEIIQSTDVELPFEPTPGPQLFLSNNTLGVIATETGEWMIDKLVVNSMFTEQRPDINYNNPFPNYPIN
ncbi:hypothetical protein [Thalassomonas actiniarum]|uniref:Uncharacterized protein n=1 Tax=Thalassomonas actiniarum TaxID=485447 RepID=A0AAE9YQH6_9GAMM|nr:hypothetical protein [Thalassomonas actiniarum]WDD98817.1 hypothetical protein SG35_026910 [Thalassomonas actiniarum]